MVSSVTMCPAGPAVARNRIQKEQIMRRPAAAANPFGMASYNDGMGWLTVRVTGNEGFDRALYWAVLLGLGYAAVSLGYKGITGHSLLGSGRTPAAWQV